LVTDTKIFTGPPIAAPQTASVKPIHCRHCNKYWHIDERCRQGIVLATQHEGWIEKCFWREDSMRAWVAALYLPVKLALAMLKYTWPLLLLLIPICSFWNGSFNWMVFLCSNLVLGGIFLLLRYFDKLVRRSFLRDFAGTPLVIVGNRGIIDVKSYCSALLIPWSSIVNASWQANAGLSSIWIQYATNTSSVAQISIQGEEWEQPLGELVDIVKAHRPGFLWKESMPIP
jgi:hypothetical protein